MLGNGFALYRHYVRISIRGQLQYRAAFAMMVIGVLVISGTEFVAVWALFDRFRQIRGWTLPEVALGYGMVSISWALCDAIAHGFDDFAGTVKRGEFDRLLLRPRSTVLQLIGQELTLRRVGRLIQGAAILGYAIAAGDIAWTPGRAVLLAAAIVGAGCVLLGILVLQATSAFWTVDTLEVWNAFTYGGLTMSQYPLAIYRAWFRALFMYVFPLGTAIYFPAIAILGRPDPVGAPPIVGWIAPLAGPVFLIVCLQIWRIGVRHYRSTGS